MAFLILLFALLAPLVLWPIEIFFPYPHLVEELAKALLIAFLLKSSDNRQKIYGAVSVGFLFGLTENFLYLFSPENVQSHLLRFMVTMPLHIATTLVILIPALINKRLIFVGILIAMLIHYLFNIHIMSVIV